MKHYFKLALLGVIVVSTNHTSWGESLKVSTLPEELVRINYNYIFSPTDMDVNASDNFGPHYSIYDLAARNDKDPADIVKKLEQRYETLAQDIENNKSKFLANINISDLILPFVPGYHGISITVNGIKSADAGSYYSNYPVGALYQDNSYGGNPLATAASHGRLDVVKAIVEWIKSKLRKLNALDKLPLYLDAPAINFGVGPTKGQLILGTPLIFAFLNKHFDIVDYLSHQGAELEGALVRKGPLSSALTPQAPDKDRKMAFIVRTDKDGNTSEPEEINIEKLILDANLKQYPELRTKAKEVVANKLYLEAQEKNRLGREERDKIRKEQEDREFSRKYEAEMMALQKQYRLEKVEAALKASRITLATNTKLMHDAAKAINIYPEFFEIVLKKRPDLADLLEEKAIEFAGRFNNYEQTPAAVMQTRATEMHNTLEQIRKQVGAPATPNFTIPQHPLATRPSYQDSMRELIDQVKANNLAAVKALIEKNPGQVNQSIQDPDFGFMTLVLFAGNKLELLKYLESKGADIHAKKDALLYYAAGSGSKDVAEYLIKKGFKVTQDAINIAIEHGFFDVAAYLQSHFNKSMPNMSTWLQIEQNQGKIPLSYSQWQPKVIKVK
ncbi:TPA: hypothetical protein DDZ86_00390 [Candidatus Dependentiae bacterium]|nr:MAG: hypothetical protein UW09_C0002G0044 [candidate division TM6 bacterium GW2011_GWF2_43_87]HBL98087.1 hypothetical protein [Candidatus Dependentiae bacterium]